MRTISSALRGLMASGILASTALATPIATASLIGDTVTCDFTPTLLGSCNPPSAVVGAGSEFQVSSAGGLVNFDIDLGASSVGILTLGPSAFVPGGAELLTLGDLDWVGQMSRIIGIENFTTQGTQGVVVGDISFTDHSVFIAFAKGSVWDVTSFVAFDLVTEHVPEPITLTLMGLGIGGLGYQRRRKKSA